MPSINEKQNAVQYNVVRHLYSDGSETEMTDKKEDKEKEGHYSYINAQSCLPILQSYHRYCCCHETHRAEYSAEHIIFLSLADAEGKISYQARQDYRNGYEHSVHLYIIRIHNLSFRVMAVA